MMRRLLVSWLLAVMLIVAVMAIDINPMDVGPEPKDLDLSGRGLKEVYQNRIRRAYKKKRDELVDALRERHGDIIPTAKDNQAAAKDVARKKKELDIFLRAQIAVAEKAKRASIGRYVAGTHSVEALRHRIGTREDALQSARDLEQRHRDRAQRYAEKAASGRLDERRKARERQQYYTDLADAQVREAQRIAEQIAAQKEQLRQIEERQVRREGGWADEHDDPEGSSGETQQFSLVEPVARHVGGFFHDRVGPWVGRYGRALRNQTPRLDHVPGGLRRPALPQPPKIPVPYYY